MAVYISQNTDTIDAICFALYGTSVGRTEPVLGANPDPALWPATPLHGLRISMPESPFVEARRVVI